MTAQTYDQYDAIEAVRFSKLKRIDISPKHYAATKFKDTDDLRLGRAIHLAVLEPAKYEANVAIWDAVDDNGKLKARKGGEWKEFAAAHKHQTILRHPDHCKAANMHDAVWANKQAASLLTGGDSEVTRTWYNEDGIKCKARWDYRPRPACVVDLKSTARIHPRDFARQAAQLQYHAQLAFYSWGIFNVDHYIIAVTKEEPFDVVVYRVPDAAIAAGQRLVRKWMALVKECTDSGKWPGIGGDQIQDLTLPEWALADDTPRTLKVGGEEIEL